MPNSKEACREPRHTCRTGVLTQPGQEADPARTPPGGSGDIGVVNMYAGADRPLRDPFQTSALRHLREVRQDIVRSFPFRSRGRLGGLGPLAVFLTATLGLAGWLGYQALDAAASHRRSAEAVLLDYASIAATRLAQIGRVELTEVLDEIFSPLGRRSRGPEVSSAEAVGWEMDDAVREQRCRCPAFRAPIALFRVDLTTAGTEFVPDTLSAAARNRIGGLVRSGAPTVGRSSNGLVTFAAGEISAEPVAVGYTISEDRDGIPEAAYGFVIGIDGLDDLFRRWYDRNRLLPAPIAGEQPNDSLLSVRVEARGGLAVFSSPVEYPTTFTASSELGPGFGRLAVHASIRPDAASQLIIGGLPNSRLPLLIALFVLTLGLGMAAVVQLRREQEFQRLRDDFISGVSHELRTPLAQIRMFAELQEAGKLELDEDRTRAVSVIHREARQLTYLVENILQFSRLRRTNGRLPPRDRIDLGDALEDGVETVTPLARNRDIRLEVEAPQGLIVLGHREALARIIVNLLDNAMKYGPPGQSIRVRARRADGVARFSVSDEGPGVPAADRDRIWNAYERLDRDVRGRVPGTGIGLSIVRELVDLYGGRAWVEEAGRGGARFVVELPLADPSARSSPSREAQESPRSPEDE